MPPLINLTGQKFHRLTVISRAKNDKHGSAMWHCLCNCGNTRIILSNSLKGGYTKSCGCFNKEQLADGKNTKHSLAKSKEYQIWGDMLTRCNNPKSTNFHLYGGRGIRVCQRWKYFETFFKDMGIRPTTNHSIERRNNNGNYEPTNCYWATHFQQARNRRTNKYITFNGKTLCITDWSLYLSGNSTLVYKRLKNGWTEEQAVSTPIRQIIRK